MITTVMAVLTAAQASAAAPARQSADPTSAFLADRVARFDVSGVRLGMTPAEASAVLARAGFRPVKTFDAPSDTWEARVTKAVAQRRPGTRVVAAQVPSVTAVAGPRGQEVRVEYSVGPDGPRAAEVRYSIRHDQITKEAFLQGVMAKYGKPSKQMWGVDLLYCSDGEKRCASAFTHSRTYLHASWNPGSVYELELSTGGDQARALDAALAAEVERRAPGAARREADILGRLTHEGANRMTNPRRAALAALLALALAAPGWAGREAPSRQPPLIEALRDGDWHTGAACTGFDRRGRRLFWQDIASGEPSAIRAGGKLLRFPPVNDLAFDEGTVLRNGEAMVTFRQGRTRLHDHYSSARTAMTVTYAGRRETVAIRMECGS